MFISYICIHFYSYVYTVKTNELDDSLPKCAATKMVTGVTLRGGLHAGNFTDVGEVGNLSMCAALCCMSQRCDLALTINKSCFIVSCYSVSLCSIKKSLTAVYKPSVAFIHRKHTKTNGKVNARAYLKNFS